MKLDCKVEEERIDGNVALTLSDGELKRLGIDTIGDKYRLVLPSPEIIYDQINEKK